MAQEHLERSDVGLCVVGSASRCLCCHKQVRVASVIELLLLWPDFSADDRLLILYAAPRSANRSHRRLSADGAATRTSNWIGFAELKARVRPRRGPHL
jgi:hypothetical protein